MNNMSKKLIVPLLLAVLILLPGCNYDDREFLPDITVPIEYSSAEIVIKEWRYLLGSGAEIYYQSGGEQVLLGTTTGGDDGYCPFSAGKYTIALEDNALLIRWHFGGDVWKETQFSLPDQDG